ncbi:MAG: BrnT family toxin [Caldilineaceae bacterium]|nr:BrnT family toxin [Caldilineaceae bacterium]
MPEDEFWWDDDNVEHIANHGVEPYEAEEVITNRPRLKRGGEGKYLAYGQTDEGRFLVVVFAPKAGNRIRVVTARDMTPIEKRRYRQR